MPCFTGHYFLLGCYMKYPCEECGLCAVPVKFTHIMGKGNSTNPLLILIGEAPGPDEAEQGIPFIGKAGKKLDQMIKEAQKDELYITNMVKCYPPIDSKSPEKGFRAPSAKEIICCQPYLLVEIEELLSTFPLPILMPLGNIALTGLIGSSKGITLEAGKLIRTTINGYRYYIIPNFHPSYILRNPSTEKQFIEIFNHALLWARRKKDASDSRARSRGGGSS